MEQGGEMRDITIKVPEKGLNEISNLTINSGDQVFRLSEIADISFGESPREILRKNQNRSGRITAQMDKDIALNQIADQIRQETASIELLPNYRIMVTGEEEKRQESMSSLGFALLLSVIWYIW
jgi:hydrophobic/amphiphilic exporter-1 (mainly G- bacteria), HAE1 family